MANRTSDGSSRRCTFYYDGASHGNPGRAGAGVMFTTGDGTTYRVREGLGIQTNNAAEYSALILGLKFARDRGFEHVTARGDSELVHRQITGQYATRNPTLRELQGEAAILIDGFKSFRSEHVPRSSNLDADYAANEAVHLRDGKVEVDRYYG